jgi:tetratricopeptide (TPR) repeat protein
MLTWEWARRRATAGRADWAGIFWYSFYERGAVMSDFCRRALAYMTCRPLSDLENKKQPELIELLMRQLQHRPWLLVLDGLERVLVAYHRADAAQLIDEYAGLSDEIADRDPCAAIHPQDDDLLRGLAATQSKILITSRLVPRVLLNPAGQPIPGVLHERLPGLRPTDAEALIRSCGIEGDSHSIRDYLQRHCDCHPLVISTLAGLVAHYLPARGDFDVWAADPQHGAVLDLGELDLVGKRNHILRAALAVLPEPSRQLLSTQALLSEAVDFTTLSTFNPHLPPERTLNPGRPYDVADLEGESAKYQRPARSESARAVERERQGPPEELASQSLSRTISDLERRGLMQYDRQANRYDLHPVVRAIAVRHLPTEELARLGQHVIDHFSALPHDPYKQASSLDELRDGLTVVRTLLRMGRTQQAIRAYRGDLMRALYFNLEANVEILSLLRPLFVQDWTSPAADLTDNDVAHVANNVALSLRALGQLDRANDAFTLSIETHLQLQNWADLTNVLTNFAELLSRQNQLAQATRCCTHALALAELLDRAQDIFLARLSIFERLACAGRSAEADRIWQSLDVMGRKWSPFLYGPGSAELAYARFKLDSGALTEDDLLRAEQLAHAGRNRRSVRGLHALRGEWLFRRDQWARACESLSEAVRMARESGVPAPAAEARLALAQLRLGQLAAPDQEAERLTGLRERADLPLAELWDAVGNTGQAIEHALAAYRYAWADGEPHVQRHNLHRAADLITALGADIPHLPAYSNTANHELSWEHNVAAAIEKLRAEKTSKYQPASELSTIEPSDP